MTLDNGRKFDLTSGSFAGDDGDNLDQENTSHFRRPHASSSNSSKGAGRGVGKGSDSKSRKGSKTTGKGTTVEAEFRDK